MGINGGGCSNGDCGEEGWSCVVVIGQIGREESVHYGNLILGQITIKQ